MNRYVALLACTTIAFAATTAYFFYRFQKLDHVANSPPPVTVPSRSIPLYSVASEGEASLPRAGGSVTGAPPETKADTGSSTPSQKAARQAVARYRLEQLRDPAGRAEQVAKMAALHRQGWQSIANYLDLSADEFAQFVSALSERTTDRIQRTLECELDPACDLPAAYATHKLAQEDDIAELLGSEKYARFKAFNATFEERNQAFFLNTQLPPAKALTESQTEQFVAALAELRQRFENAAVSRGEKLETVAGMATLHSSAVAGAPDEPTLRIKSATAYLQEQRERASSILDAEQLLQYKTFQDVALAGYKDMLQLQEVSKSARQAAPGD